MAIEVAWINFTPGAVPVINAGKRIASVGRNGVGDYSVNLTDDLVSATVAGVPDLLGILPFATMGGIAAIPAQANLRHIQCEVVSRREIRIRTNNFAAAADDPAEISMYVHADLLPIGE